MFKSKTIYKALKLARYNFDTDVKIRSWFQADRLVFAYGKLLAVAPCQTMFKSINTVL
ncbi:hypothetical protein HMPREF9554_02004 [Treponema phagedenis F0421]|nr:hypothetical protein HMPREF9554_02004 [Treponema phagedenis F0421]